MTLAVGTPDRDGTIHWADNREELWERFSLNTDEERMEPKSVSFISSNIYDNKVLLKANPQYLANLKALATVERERLLYGNWKIKAAAGLFFKRTQVGNILEVIPGRVSRQPSSPPPYPVQYYYFATAPSRGRVVCWSY